MRIGKIGLAALATVGALSLGGCAYDDYGYGGGYGYGAPYGGVSVGLGYGGGYGYYGSPYYGGYGYGGYSPFGWYDDFYYPGTGFYVYDSYRRPHRWSDSQRHYWTQRTNTWRNTSGSTWNRTDRTDRTQSTTTTQPNWSGFDRGSRDGRHRRR